MFLKQGLYPEGASLEKQATLVRPTEQEALDYRSLQVTHISYRETSGLQAAAFQPATHAGGLPKTSPPAPCQRPTGGPEPVLRSLLQRCGRLLLSS